MSGRDPEHFVVDAGYRDPLEDRVDHEHPPERPDAEDLDALRRMIYGPAAATSLPARGLRRACP